MDLTAANAPSRLVAMRGVAASVRLRLGVLLVLPAVALVGFVGIPLLLLLRISVAPADLAALWSHGFTWRAYASLLEQISLAGLLHSLQLAALVASISVGIAVPLTYLITRMPRRWQVVWLVVVLASLTLSDVLIAFSWEVMLSKRIGLSRLLVWAGLMDQADSLAPSLGAVVACLVYYVMPFAVFILYPPLSQLDYALLEAARTLGAPPLRVYASVLMPLIRGPAILALLMCAVITIGAYVPPIVLGRPQHWTMAVLIGNAALAGHDLPRAAAMSVLLLAVAAVLALGTLRTARSQRTS